MHRRTKLAVLAAAIFLTAPATALAGPTQTFTPGAELLNQPKGQPWDMNLFIGTEFGTDDGAPISAVRRMRMSFPSGARFNGDKFKTCTLQKVETGNCPAASKIGKGTALTLLGTDTVDATITVYNGPGTSTKRQVFLYSRALSTIAFVLTGTMRKTSGTYGYVLDINVPPIIETLVKGGVPIKSFETTIGGSVRRGNKRIPLLSSPTKCRGGWKFAASFTYADGSTGSNTSAIPCRLAATPTS